MTQDISPERIERASEPLRNKYCRGVHCLYPGCKCRSEARAILAADAPEIAAAELRGRMAEAKRAHYEIAYALCDVSVDADMFMQVREHFGMLLASRIAALEAEMEKVG